MSKEPNTFLELFNILLRPLRDIWRDIYGHFHTSIHILLWRDIAPLMEASAFPKLRDINFVGATYALFIGVMVIRKIAGVEIGESEMEELVLDAFLLILFLLTLLLLICCLRAWKYLFRLKLKNRLADAYVIYEYCMLYLPSYFIFINFIFDEKGDFVGGSSLLLLLGFWYIHMTVQFFKMSQKGEKNKWVSALGSITLATVCVFFYWSGLFVVFALIYAASGG